MLSDVHVRMVPEVKSFVSQIPCHEVYILHMQYISI